MAEKVSDKKGSRLPPSESYVPWWISCSSDLVRQFSRFHSRMMDDSSSRIRSEAHAAFAAEQPSLGLIEKRWAEDEVTDLK